MKSTDSNKEKDGLTSVAVRLDAFQSSFIVFYHGKKSVEKMVNNPGKFTETKTINTLEGPWNVSFDTLWGGPRQIIFNELTDWSKRPEDGIRYYSGTAVYTQIL